MRASMPPNACEVVKPPRISGAMSYPLKMIDAAKLKPYERNARTHPPEQIDQIKALIRMAGFVGPLLYDFDADHLIAGHGRLIAAQQMIEADEPIPGPGKRDMLPKGKLPVIDGSGMSEVERRAFVITDNAVALRSGWDRKLLGFELESLQGFGFDMALLAFEPGELQSFMPVTPPPGDPEKVPPMAKVAISRPGDIWLLGGHRLICGDCTDRAVVERLMAGGRACMTITDPPYGIAGSASEKGDYASYDDTEANLIAMIEQWLPHAIEFSDAQVITPGTKNLQLYPRSKWTLCWFYGGGQLRSPWGFNCWQPILAYGPDPSLARGKGSRPDAVNLNTPANLGDIDHPCPKPIALWTWLFERVTFEPGDVVYDPFMGSGTTIIVAEQLQRVALGVEIDPLYVDVTIRRWQEFTGKLATLDGDGRTFDEIARERESA